MSSIQFGIQKRNLPDGYIPYLDTLPRPEHIIMSPFNHPKAISGFLVADHCVIEQSTGIEHFWRIFKRAGLFGAEWRLDDSDLDSLYQSVSQYAVIPSFFWRVVTTPYDTWVGYHSENNQHAMNKIPDDYICFNSIAVFECE